MDVPQKQAAKRLFGFSKMTFGQKRTVDCGLACICKIAQKRYTKKFEIKMKNKTGRLRTYEEDIRFGFKILNFHLIHNFRRLKRWDIIRKNKNISIALTGINYNNNKDTWHWVVYYRNKGNNDYFWDPKKSREERTVFRKGIKLRSYLPIK